MSEEQDLDVPLAHNDHEQRRVISPNKLQFAAEIARKKHPERRIIDPVRDLTEANYSKEAAEAGGGPIADSSPREFDVKHGHVRQRKTMHGVELQIETLSPIGSRVLLYSWYAVLIVALIIQSIPSTQWGCQNICGEKCDINDLGEISSGSCFGFSQYNVTSAVNATTNVTVVEQDVFWGGSGGGLSREKLSRFALIALVMPRPNTTSTGDLSISLSFALSISNVSSEYVKLGDVIGRATLQCAAKSSLCDPIILSTNFAQAATNYSSISVVLQEVPQSVADVADGAAVSFVSQIPRYTIATIVLRYAGMAGSLLHLVRFVAHKKFTDDLYEQTWVLVLHLGLFLYLDPLFAAGVYIRPSPQFMTFVEYRMPIYFLAVFVAFMYSLITSAMHWTSSDVYHPPWKTKIIPFVFIAVVITLDIVDASLKDWDWSAEHCPHFSCTVPGYLMYITLGLGVLICTVWLRWLYNNLGLKPYLESRPQQLACRLFIFIFVTVVLYLVVQLIIVLAVYHKISELTSYQPLLQIGPIMVFIAFANILTFAYTTTVRSDKVPLKPTDPRWKRIYWNSTWYQWLSLHGGSMYMFTNELEEMLFYYIQEKHEREIRKKSSGSSKEKTSKSGKSPVEGNARSSYARYLDRYGSNLEGHSYGAVASKAGRGRGGSSYDGELCNVGVVSPNQTPPEEAEGPSPFEQKIKEYEEELRAQRNRARRSMGEGFQLLGDHDHETTVQHASDDDGSASIEEEEAYDPQSYYANQDGHTPANYNIEVPSITVAAGSSSHGGARKRSSSKIHSKGNNNNTDDGSRQPTPTTSPGASKRVQIEEPEEGDEQADRRRSLFPSPLVSMGRSMGKFVRKTMVDAPAHLLDKVEDKVLDFTAAALQLRRKPFFNLESCIDCFNMSWEAYGVKTSGGDVFVSTGIEIEIPGTEVVSKALCCFGLCGWGRSHEDEQESEEEGSSEPSPSSPKSQQPSKVAHNPAISGDSVLSSPPLSPIDGGRQGIKSRQDSVISSSPSNASIGGPQLPAAPTTPPINVEQYGYELIAVFEALDVQVIITKMVCNVDRHSGKNPRIVISFRGTDNASNAKQDIRIRRVDWTEMHTPSSNSVSAFMNWKTYSPPSVHSGFLEVWSALRGTVLTEVSDILLHQPVDAEPLKLYVTGHSLGGALAALCAYSLKRTLKIESPIVYTFGQPRLGNKTFQQEYDKEVPNTFRIVNESDVVSTITMFGGCHVGVEIGIDRNGNYISEPMFIERMFRPTKGKGSAIANHTMTAYGESINSIANSGVFGECPSRCLVPYVSEDKVMALVSRRVYHELRQTEKQKGNYDPELYQHIYEPKRSNTSLAPR